MNKETQGESLGAVPNINARVACPDPQCGALSGHSPRCSLAPVEYKASQMLHYYEAWLKLEMAVRGREDHANKRVKWAAEERTKWQGKFRIVCHENNVLRRKLQRVPSPKSTSNDSPEARGNPKTSLGVTTDTQRLEWLIKACGLTDFNSKRKRIDFIWDTENFQLTPREAIDKAMLADTQREN